MKTTEQEIKEIASRLRELIAKDNDTVRFMREQGILVEIFELEDDVIRLEDELNERDDEIESLEKEIEKLEKRIEELEEQLED